MYAEGRGKVTEANFQQCNAHSLLRLALSVARSTWCVWEVARYHRLNRLPVPIAAVATTAADTAAGTAAAPLVLRTLQPAAVLYQC